MAIVSDHQHGTVRSFSNTRPTHYRMKIRLFSLLAKHEVEKHESMEFEAGGYKWKLVLYPNGNKSKGVKDHISLYLALMADTSSLPLGWEVCAVFRFFLLDQNKGKYLTVEDALEKEKCFHEKKLQWGFDQFFHLKQFNDTCNGYLVDDTCVIGAEVFVTKETSSGKGQCFSMITDGRSFKHVWKIENFSKVKEKSYDSEVFEAGGQKWKIILYPKGNTPGVDRLSLFLALAEITPASNVFAEYTMRILDQVNAKHTTFKTKHSFRASSPSWGWSYFVSSSGFYDPASGCLVKDVCFVEAEVTVLGIAKEM
ncbi:Ubiquitin carboxyl-terminal hydrolase 12 [Melia azedarach]|uniref:Ubiquitin carboxyl-terminal hydrolase 12 n=1 Tax=Melia azedarach TaxID=155640 RepID=A0ACC1YCP4_MELAZ|nr:Ubiquitin carboxyl-terminal hydrolase 12 [Melia azedarach]